MADPIVTTSAGALRGSISGEVLAFKGIPYAAPPTGARRWRPPEPAPSWSGVRDALEYVPSCPQPSQRPPGWSQEPSESEDCLYLNVWTPGADDARRPVMVWLHGGGFSIGSGSWPLYDGAALARRGDVVVVTVNHRLGIFGYMHLADALGPDYATSGNAGMLDLVATLEWVRDNIAEFGGDASNVTIFGESGGGAKVSTLHAMPAARGLFHRAVVQSGPGLRVRGLGQANEAAAKTLADLGAGGDRNELAALSVDALKEAQRKRGGIGMRDFSPVLDGISVVGHPCEMLADGSAPDVPMIVGCNRDEATLFFAADPAMQDPSTLEGSGLSTRLATLGPNAEQIVAAYRAARAELSPRDLFVAIESDRMVRLPSISLAEHKLAGTSTPVFMYLFTWSAGPLGSAHGFEIPFVFDNARPPVMEASPSRDRLATAMSEAWLSFARTGTPDRDGLAPWPAYTTADRTTMIFARDGCAAETDPFGAQRRAWEGKGAPMGIAV